VSTRHGIDCRAFLFSEKDSQSTIWAIDAAAACIFRYSGGGSMADFDRIKQLEIAGAILPL